MNKEYFHEFADLTESGKFKEDIELKVYRGEEIPSSVVLYQPFRNGQEPEVGELIGFTTNWPKAGVFWEGNGICIRTFKKNGYGGELISDPTAEGE